MFFYVLYLLMLAIWIFYFHRSTMSWHLIDEYLNFINRHLFSLILFHPQNVIFLNFLFQTFFCLFFFRLPDIIYFPKSLNPREYFQCIPSNLQFFILICSLFFCLNCKVELQAFKLIILLCHLFWQWSFNRIYLLNR